MFSLRQKVKERQTSDGDGQANRTGRISVRDRLLTKEIPELMSCELPGLEARLLNPDIFHEFYIEISPTTGYWSAGTFDFHVLVPVEYNILPPKVTCKTRIWHPNIAENGDVCLSLLRESSMDETGWSPVRTLKDVAFGLYALFDDLLNFDDPLNTEAANQYHQDKSQFIQKAREYTARYASKR